MKRFTTRILLTPEAIVHEPASVQPTIEHAKTELGIAVSSDEVVTTTYYGSESSGTHAMFSTYAMSPEEVTDMIKFVKKRLTSDDFMEFKRKFCTYA